MQSTTAEFPYFAFGRRRDIELEAGFILAGQLVLDEPTSVGKSGLDELKQTVATIIKKLTEMAQSGKMSDRAL